MFFISINLTKVYDENIEISLLILQKYGFCLNFKNRIYGENIEISLLVLQKYGFRFNYKNRIYDENIDIYFLYNITYISYLIRNISNNTQLNWFSEEHYK